LGRGVTAAYLTFNQAGVGSNPSDPTDRIARTGAWLSGESSVLIRRRSKVRFLPRQLIEVDLYE
jgi:hypothetical protein